MWWRKAKPEAKPSGQPQTDMPAYNLRELIIDRGSIIDLASGAKGDALSEMLDALAAEGKVPAGNIATIHASLMAREAKGHTAVGNGFAVPHPLPDASALMPVTFVAVGRSRDGIDWGGGELVHVILLKLGPCHALDDNHLRTLELCTRLCRHPHARERLLRHDPKLIHLFIDEVDAGL